MLKRKVELWAMIETEIPQRYLKPKYLRLKVEGVEREIKVHSIKLKNAEPIVPMESQKVNVRRRTTKKRPPLTERFRKHDKWD